VPTADDLSMQSSQAAPECCNPDTNTCSFAQYVRKPTDNLPRAEDYFGGEPHIRETKMSAIRVSASSKYAGLLPIEPSDEFVRPIDLEPGRPVDLKPEGVRFLNSQPSLRRRASRALALLLITFYTGLGIGLLRQSYGDAAREMIANSHPQLRWLAPQPTPIALNSHPPTIIAPVAPSSIEQLNAMSFDPDAVGQTDAVGQNDKIGTASSQEPVTRPADRTTTSIVTGQEQMTRSTDQTVARIAQLLSGEDSSLTVGSRANGTSLQPTVSGKQLAAPSGHDPSCFPSASALQQNHRGRWPTGTLRAPGHEGALCLHAAARPRGSDHRARASDRRSEMMLTENGLSAPSAPRRLAGWWGYGLP
jgi:hypothetical protein